MIGQSAFGTGDINLAAALTTLGIPPDPAGAIELIARDNGRDYVRFHFLPHSMCGKFVTLDLSAAWNTPAKFKAEHPVHPFALLMDFISTRPRGCSNQDDWISHAAAFLGVKTDTVRATYRRVDLACQASPESPVSYVCAYIRNRVDAITAAKQMADKGQFKNMQDRGKSVSLISAKAPRRIRDFLLSHIR